jgi:hypothetical protein
MKESVRRKCEGMVKTMRSMERRKIERKQRNGVD